MEKIILSTENYCVCEATEECLMELSEFIVSENYKHHSSDNNVVDYNQEISDVLKEEQGYRNHSRVFFARDHKGKLVGSIRVFKWDRKETLPIQKIFNINPLSKIGDDESYTYWHIGRFAVDSQAQISPVKLFKLLMTLAIEPIVQEANSFMIAEIDSKLLRVMNTLGIKTVNLGAPIYYLASNTVPVYSSKSGLIDFYNRHKSLKKAS